MTLAVAASTCAYAAASATPLGALTATFTRTSDWGTGYVATYTITNHSTTSAHGWTLSFTLAPGETYANGWNGVSVVTGTSVTGVTVTVAAASWDADIASGASVQFGFQVGVGAADSPPTICTINGVGCSGSPPVTTVPATTASSTTLAPPSTTSTTALPSTAALRAVFTETQDWGSGFIADVTITDTGSVGVSGWTLTFSLPVGETVTEAWNGTLSSTPTGYVVVNASWNGTLSPGQSVHVGMQGTLAVPFRSPTTCAVNGWTCSSGGPPAPTTTTLPPTTVPTSTTSLPPVPPNAHGVFAPYVDTTLDPPSAVVAAASASPGHLVSLGFVVAAGAQCTASWGSYYTVSSGYLATQIAQIRTMGGDVIASFGGAAGTDLAASCPTVSALEDQYRAVVQEYALTRIDFDVEGAAEFDTASLQRRFQAVATLQHSIAGVGGQLSVSLTLPVLPTGLDQNGLAVLGDALSAGVAVSVVNVMAMDYGDWAAPHPSGWMGTYAIDAATATEAQIAAALPRLSAPQAWSMVGITPMIGVNDVSDEVFGLSDAQEVASFAAAHGVGRIAMWSSNRDVQCAGGVVTYASPSCSGVIQTPGQFAAVLGKGG